MSNSSQLRETLRQIVAVLEAERQALAGLELETIMGCARDKQVLCGAIEQVAVLGNGAALDEECRGLADAARRLNAINRQIRNLVAANVSARLDALTGAAPIYQPGATPRSAYAMAAPAR